MTSPSPSEFLTFMRTGSRVMTASMRSNTAARPSIHSSIASRTFASSPARLATGDANDKKHATDKTDQLDVQSANAGAAKAAKSQQTGGTATQQQDDRNSTAKAKKEHPEAPDVVIGMQDERGGKGH